MEEDTDSSTCPGIKGHTFLHTYKLTPLLEREGGKEGEIEIGRDRDKDRLA